MDKLLAVRTTASWCCSNCSSNMDFIFNESLNFDDLVDMLVNDTQAEDFSSVEVDTLDKKHWSTVISVIYCFVLVFGFFENITIIVYFIKNKSFLKQTNIFILVLTVSDIFLCAFTFPLKFHSLKTNSWVFGEMMCKLSHAMLNVPVLVSSITVLMIAANEYRQTKYPQFRRMSNTNVVCQILCAVLLSILIEIPTITHMKYVLKDSTTVYVLLDSSGAWCFESWTSLEQQRWYTVSTLTIRQIPLLMSLVIHIHIGHVLKHCRLARQEQQRKQKTNYILTAISIVFFMCRLPMTVVWFIAMFSESLFNNTYTRVIMCLVLILAVGTAYINPFLYAFLNNNFRRQQNISHYALNLQPMGSKKVSDCLNNEKR